MSAVCVQGHVGPGLGILPCTPLTPGTAQRQKPFTQPLPRFPLKHKPTVKPTLGFQSIVRVLLFGSFFGYLPLSGGRGGRVRMQGSAPVLSQRPPGPPPPAAYVYNVQSVPLPAKRVPAASENGRGCRKGMGASPSPK